MTHPTVTPADIEALETKLETLTETLGPGERAVLERLLALAAAGHSALQSQEGDVQGFLMNTLTTSNVFLVRKSRVNLLRSSLASRLSTCGGSSCSECKGKGGSSYGPAGGLTAGR